MVETDKRRAHLWLAPATSGYRDLSGEIRAARRDMARWLRALHASGRGVSSWPDDVVTRLAHMDVTTARYLIDSTGVTQNDALEGLRALRTLERWVLDRMSAAERAEVQEFALMIRVEDSELESPLWRPEAVADEGSSPKLSMRSLRAGIQSLSDTELAQVGQRLGVPRATQCPRPSLEAQVQHTLRDDHLLGILIATLTLAAHKILAALVRQRFDDATHSVTSSWSDFFASGGDDVQQLRNCGLVYQSQSGRPAPDLWVPVELQRRLDGVLRAFGV